MSEEIFRRDSFAKSCEATITAADDNGVQLSRTVFYPTGGGQPGDKGFLRFSDGRVLKIVDTRKLPKTGEQVHVLEGGQTLPTVGEAVVGEIDWDVRYRLMRMHTCMHLLCAIIPEGVTGGSVGAEKSRLDFNLPDKIPVKEELTEELNRLIAEDHEVHVRSITDAELESQLDLVRTMSVKPPMGVGTVRLIEIENVGLQPCGGTHVGFTGEIGKVRIAKIENKGKQNRRIHIVFDEG